MRHGGCHLARQLRRNDPPGMIAEPEVRERVGPSQRARLDVHTWEMPDETVSLATMLEGLPSPTEEPPTGLDAFHVMNDDAPFVEPALREYEIEANPQVTFVSARGASGKSTMARHLSRTIKAPLWSLGDDAAVSGDALGARLSSYLGTASPLDATDRVPVLIVDALDEARLRVSGLSWDQFVASLTEYAKAGVHLVMLGRKRTVEDVWVEFASAEIGVQWFEISHFDEARQREYVDLRVFDGESLTSGDTYVKARDLVLADLNGESGGDLDATFAGYAPVLDAVAALLAPGTNYQSLLNTFGDLGRGLTTRVGVLRQILDELLVREFREKVAPLAHELGLPDDAAFTPEEQLDWLANELLGGPPPDLAWCPPDKQAQYVKQLRTFLEQHPYRHDEAWASPVFSSYVAFRRFDQVPGPVLADLAMESGLLFDFHVEAQMSSGSKLLLSQDQFTALHRSLTAGQWHSSTSVVSVRSPEVAGDELPDEAHVALALVHRGSSPLTVDADLLLEQAGELHLTSPLSNLDVEVGGSVVISSPTSIVDLGPDLYVRADVVQISGSSVQVGKGPGGDGSSGPSVELAANESFEVSGELVGNPSVYEFVVSVPDSVALTFPWVTYRGALELDEEDAAHDVRALRFLNKLMSLTRRDGHRGRRAVYIKKLEGRQGLQGEEFQAALAILEDAGAVSVEQDLVFYSDDWEASRFDGKGRPGLPSFEDKRAVWDPLLASITTAIAR